MGDSMKKSIISAVAMAAACASIGAQSWTDLFKMSAWGRAVVTPLSISEGGSSVSAATGNAGSAPSIGFKVAGTAPSGKIGFNLDLGFEFIVADDGSVSGDFAPGDSARIWCKPLDFLKFDAGWFVEDDLRGSIGNSMFASWLLPNGGKGEDAIFTRFKAAKGAYFKIEPLFFLDSEWKGLAIEGAFGSSNAPLGSGSGDERANRDLIDLSAADVFRRMQVGLGYTIPEIGFFRAQFIGNNRTQLQPDYTNAASAPAGQTMAYGLSSSGDADVVEAAFKLTAIDGLVVDVGVKIPFEYTTETSFVEYPALKPNFEVMTNDDDLRVVQRPYCVSAAASWNPSFLEPLKIVARADASIGGTVESPGQRKIFFGADVGAWLLSSYALGEDLTVGVDLGIELKQRDQWQQPIGKEVKSNTEGSGFLDLGFGPWVELNLGGGSLRAGAMVMLPGSERWAVIAFKDGTTTKYMFVPTFTGDPIISFPISLTYSL
jgi:hypothetical protein